jgi:hypothetical protein
VNHWFNSQRILNLISPPLRRWAVFFLYSGFLFLALYLIERPAYFGFLFSISLAALMLWPFLKFQIMAVSGLIGLYFGNSFFYSPRGPVIGLLSFFGYTNFLLPPLFFLILVVISIGICMTYRAWVARLPPSTLVRRYPFFVFLSVYLACVLSIPWRQFAPWLQFCYLLVTIGLSGFVVALGFDLEALHLRNPMKGFSRAAFYLYFWKLYFVAPFKGESYLRSVQVTTSAEIDRVRLKALRLIVWAVVLQFIFLVFRNLVFQRQGPAYFSILEPYCLNLPTMAAALGSIKKGETFHPFIAWTIVFAEFFSNLFRYTVFGHIMVSLARMAGFNIFRNTYRPFEAKSFNEFFSRYNYYYKELLLHLFYFPVFFGFFRNHKRLRVVFAVVASVGIGNFLIILVGDIHYFKNFGTAYIFARFLPYAFYCLVLSVVLSFSTLYQIEKGRKPISGSSSMKWTRPLMMILIVTFFAVLRIFDEPFNGPIQNNFEMLLNLFGRS